VRSAVSTEAGEDHPNLARLLASLAIEGVEALSAHEARECLRNLGTIGRQSVARWLWQKLKEAGPQAPVLWQASIGPWLASAWPREPNLRDSRTSETLVLAATVVGDRFADAVECLSEFVAPVEHAHMFLDALRDNGLARTAPEASLELVNLVTPAQPGPWFGPLGRFLEELRGVRAVLVDDLRFQRLHNIAIQSGL
jgi:hypothetical protein